MKKPSIKAAGLKKPSLPEIKKPSFDGLPGGSRTGRSLLAAVAVLGVVFGIAELRPPADPSTAGTAGGATTAQVERSTLVCPPPHQGLFATTDLTLFDPAAGKAEGGSASLSDVVPTAGAAAKPSAAPSGSPSASPSGSASAKPSAGASAAPAAGARLTLAKPGVPVTGRGAPGDTAPGTVATATGGFAPGFSLSQTTTYLDQARAGLYGLDCAPSGTDFWFAGASTAQGRDDYVNLVNADSAPATVDIRLVGAKGAIDVEAANGITMAPGSSQRVRLKSLLPSAVEPDLAVHVVVRDGRVGAALNVSDEGKGGDWVAASAVPAPVQVLPGLPAELASARLIVAAPADDDADLKIQISGKNGWFTPAGKESLHVKAGMVAALDLGPFNHNEAGAIRLSPSDPAHSTPVIATVRVDRSNNGKADAAWISAAGPVGKRASLADNRGGGATTVYLTATGSGTAKVRLTASAGTGGGTPATKEVDVPAGSTVVVQNLEPAGLNGSYGITAETVSGGPVVAARMLALPQKDIPMFTVQGFRDDHSTVTVPYAQNDPGLVLR
ncbi:DUF5719 family protein [Kitasatospora sp. DSM 101779]|uniref:DUF5719 family protein n=1 Tax=Kitasatospora sp. DSM 101779 TaxID=2853165 RepID=UPI0021DB6A80|nr:DUF5719 family protein [Kitasatospora sp. DSM 101779]MCU7824497.1 hypothetical protein [Kitasatospora sp. DSM 101779]